MRKVLVSWLIVVALLASSVAGWAQSGGYYKGLEDGRADAREDINGTAQFALGACSWESFTLCFQACRRGNIQLIDWLSERKEIHLQGEDTDLRLTYEGRSLDPESVDSCALLDFSW